MTAKQIQSAILRELRGAGKAVTRDQLHALCMAGQRTYATVTRFTSVLHGLVNAGRVAHKLDSSVNALRYSLPREIYRLRNMVSVWYVDRPDRDRRGQWHTVVMGTQMEAEVCHLALNAHNVKIENSYEALTAETARMRAKRATRGAPP